MDEAGGGGSVSIDVAGMRALVAGLRQVDAHADAGPSGVAAPVDLPPVARQALGDLVDAVEAGSVAMHDEVAVLVAFVEGAVEAFTHLDRSAVSGRRP